MRNAHGGLVIVAAVLVGGACATNPKPFDCAAPPQNLKETVCAVTTGAMRASD